MRLPRGVRRLFRLDALEASGDDDIDEELDFHLAETVRRLRSEGMSEGDARAAARRRFGNVAAYRRALRDIDQRGTRTGEGIERMDVIRRNIAFALRGIRRSPGFALAVVAILSLGIGANAVMFGVVDRLLLSPPQHVADPQDVRQVYVQRTIFNGTRPVQRTITYPDYVDFAGVGSFEATAAYASSGEDVMGQGEEAEQVVTTKATASLFPLLGVRASVGRFYSDEEDDFGANPVAVLSDEFWSRRFGRDRSVIGRSLDIGRGRYEVVGIAPAGFTGAELGGTDVWLPLVRAQELDTGGTDWADGEWNRGWWWLRAVVRLRDGATTPAAADEATAAHRGARADKIAAGDYSDDADVVLAPIIAAQGPEPSDQARVARWLAGVSFVVLLIACFNVANLLLARASRWKRELAVRSALGVSRGRLLAQLLTESLVLALMGAAGALAVAWIGGGALHRVLLPDVAFTDTGLNGRLLGFLGATTVLTALTAGLLPALQASRTNVADALRSGGRGTSSTGARTRVVLLVAQAALSAVLLVGAGLFVQSLRNAQATDLGFDARQILVMRPQWGSPTRLGALEDGAADVTTADKAQAMDAALARLRRIPGVQAAGFTYAVPFRSSYGLGAFRTLGGDTLPDHPDGGPYANKVGAGYFEAMGLEILQGRGFTESDDSEGAPRVMVVTEGLARALWPAGDPIGQCVTVGKGEEGEPPACHTVVGVVEDHRRQDLVEERANWLYFLNLHNDAMNGPPQGIMMGTAGPPAELVDDVRKAVRDAAPQIRFADTWPLMEPIAEEMRSWQLGATMFTVFGLLALVVAGVGLYSVLAFDVALRQHELGIRSALGAGMPRLVRMVLRRAVVLAGIGVALGLVVALAGSGFVEPLLFEVSARSPLVYVGVAGALALVAFVAGSLPAWRVTRVDPRTALQAE